MSNLPLTICEDDIKTYRRIYYDWYEPFLIEFPNIPNEDIDSYIKHMLAPFNWTVEEFKLFYTIDLFQRMAKSKQNVIIDYGNYKFTKDELRLFLKLPKLCK